MDDSLANKHCLFFFHYYYNYFNVLIGSKNSDIFCDSFNFTCYLKKKKKQF